MLSSYGTTVSPSVRQPIDMPSPAATNAAPACNDVVQQLIAMAIAVAIDLGDA